MASSQHGLLAAVEGFLGRLLGKQASDPLADITADQLHIVLRSIEEKYGLLQDENRRLTLVVEEQRRELLKLTKALETSQRDTAHRDRGLDTTGPGEQEDLRRV